MNMFSRLLCQSFLRQRRRKLLAGIAIVLGVAVATAMIAVATDIGDKMNRELRSYGANLVLYPDTDTLDVEIGGVNMKPASDGAYLKEADLIRMKQGFWRHNIVSYAPVLPIQADVNGSSVDLIGTYFEKHLGSGSDAFTTGAKTTYPWWKVTGAWPRDDSDRVLLGERLAARLGRKPGDTIQVAGRKLKVAGILFAGSSQDDAIVAPLALVQNMAGKPGLVRRVYVSALTKPEDDLARRDPNTLSPDMKDRWICSPYANSIAYELQQDVPRSRAEQIRQVAQNEGSVLAHIEGLMLLVTLAALLASALAVSSAMATAILERRAEVGLMKALGAGNATVAALFLAESALLAVIGGLVGFGAGDLLARQIGQWIFGSRLGIQPVLLPIVLGIAVVVTFAGSAASIRKAMAFDPVFALRGDA